MRTMVTSCCVNFLAARSEICGGVARAAQLVEILGQRVSCGVEFEAEKEGGVRAWGGPGSVACLVSGRDRLGRQVHEACGGRKESGGRLEKATRRSRGGSSSGQLSVRVHAGGCGGTIADVCRSRMQLGVRYLAFGRHAALKHSKRTRSAFAPQRGGSQRPKRLAQTGAEPLAGCGACPPAEPSWAPGAPHLGLSPRRLLSPGSILKKLHVLSTRTCTFIRQFHSRDQTTTTLAT